MSSKKTKLLESAQRNILKGQLDRAITEYRQIIELDPSDLRHRQKIAELLTKTKRNDEAIKEYAFIAKHYIDSDHYLKAIAVYKQIQKLDPQNPEITLTLASLNEKQGLIGNAVAEYAAIIQIYEKNGENLKALKALESIIALDADNSAVKLRIAEKYFTVGSEDQSFDAFFSLLQGLKQKNDENGFSLIAERAVNLFGERMKEALGQTPANSAGEVMEEQIESETSENIIPVSDIHDLKPETISALPDSTHEPTGMIDTDSYEELECIEDILPISEDETSEQTAFYESCDAWEEEIELPSQDDSPAPMVTQTADREELEELDTFDELDEIELEMEIDNELPIDQTDFPDISVSPPNEDFDLGKDLSLFADEIDFDLFGKQDQSTVFDITNSGFTKGELDNEDAESHYSLGLAYKEMGLWDEAIAEFIVASHSPERKIDSLILEGVCFREIGNVAKAIEILADTLEYENITEDECLGVKYELALCHEASGDFALTRSLLTEIVKVRSTFSDVTDRLKNLAAY